MKSANGASSGSGGTKCAPELAISDFEATLASWCDVLGFRIVTSERFADLENSDGISGDAVPADGKWEMGALEHRWRTRSVPILRRAATRTGPAGTCICSR